MGGVHRLRRLAGLGAGAGFMLVLAVTFGLALLRFGWGRFERSETHTEALRLGGEFYLTPAGRAWWSGLAGLFLLGFSLFCVCWVLRVLLEVLYQFGSRGGRGSDHPAEPGAAPNSARDVGPGS